jgi:hypothetical protein
MFKSQGYKNIMTALAVVESTLLKMKDDKEQDWYIDLLEYIEEGLEYCEEIFNNMPALLSQKDIERFSINMNHLENTFFVPYTDLLVMFSFITLLFEEPIEKSKNSHVNLLMAQLNLLIANLHAYFEKRDPDTYDAVKYGDQAFQFWKKLKW